MFQTDIILYLQSLASEGLTAVMTVLTSLGNDKFLAIILLFVIFSISFRKGVLLTQIFMWIGLATDGMKALFNMPRPPFVHAGIQNLQHGEFDATPFTSPGAENFLSGMDPEVLIAFRERNDQSWGFPSGHVSSTVALWGGIALLFKRKVLCWLAVVLTILVALTRMYLGRHFLGDVLGGILLAVGVLWLVHLTMARWPFLVQPQKRRQFTGWLPGFIYYVFWIAGPLLLAIFSPDVLGKFAGYLIGLNCAYLLLNRSSLPGDAGSLFLRLARGVLAMLLFFAAYGLSDLFLEGTGLDRFSLVERFLEAAVIMFVCVWGTVKIGLKFGLYMADPLEAQVVEPKGQLA